MFESIQSFDLAALSWMRDYHQPVLIWAAWAVATVAWKGWLWGIIFVASWFRGNRLFAAQLGFAIAIATVAGLPLKSVIARARPDLYASQQLNIPMPELLSTTHSFPSGHTMLATAFAIVVIAYYKDWRAWLAAAFVVAVGLARVYQAMHWPSDVLGSIILGAFAAYLAGFVVRLPALQRWLSSGKATISTHLQTESTRQREIQDAVGSRR